VTTVASSDRLLPMAASSPAACCVPLGAATLSDDEAEATAAVFKALADRHRVRIVNHLATSSEPVCACDFNG
jgi:ArsR family transcriptional regulator